MHYATPDMTEVMGIGSYVGQVRRGPDGELYQWVEGVDGLGNPIGGWWSKIKRGVKKAARAVKKYHPASIAYRAGKSAVKYARKPWCIPLRALPRPVRSMAKKVCRVVGRLSPLKYVPVVGGYYRGFSKLCNLAKGCGIAGVEGEIMQAPDGQHYEVVEDIGAYGEPRAYLKPVQLIINARIQPRRQGVRTAMPRPQAVPRARPSIPVPSARAPRRRVRRYR